MLQTASVCQKFADAARLIEFSVKFIWPGDDFENDDIGPLPSRYNSALLLSWAPCSLRGIDLDLDACAHDGLLQLFQVSKKLTAVILKGSSAAAHHLADKLLLASPSTLIDLDCYDGMIPTVFPPQLETLSFDIKHVDMARKEALFLRLSRMTQLRSLSFTLGSQPQLPSAVHISSSLNLYLWLDMNDDTELQLDWLRGQAYHELGLQIHMHTEDFDQHHDTLIQLADLVINGLSIEMHMPFTEPLQELWGCLQGMHELFLEIHHAPAPLPAPMINALPGSRYLRLCVTSGVHQDIAWAALSQGSCNIRIRLESSQTLAILGFPGSLPEDAGGHGGCR